MYNRLWDQRNQQQNLTALTVWWRSIHWKTFTNICARLSDIKPTKWRTNITNVAEVNNGQRYGNWYTAVFESAAYHDASMVSAHSWVPSCNMLRLKSCVTRNRNSTCTRCYTSKLQHYNKVLEKCSAKRLFTLMATVLASESANGSDSNCSQLTVQT